MRLSDFVSQYALHRDLRPGSILQLQYAVNSLERVAGREVDTSEFSAELLNGWINARLGKNARKTIAVQRGAFLSLWKDAARLKLAPPMVGDVRRVRVPKPIPQAWLPAEFQGILNGLDQITGAFPCGVPRRLMLRAAALVGYYSGLRSQDLLALLSCDLVDDSTVVIRQQKTGEAIKVSIPADAMAAILETKPFERERLFPMSRKTLWFWFSRVVAGKGSPKWLRRTGATRCEQQQPGSAMAYLGHLTPGLAYKHYVDLRQISDTKPMPPAP